MTETLRSFLEFEWLTGLSLGWVTALIVAGYAVVLVYGASRSEDVIYEGAPDRRRSRDLRLWLIPVVLAQIVLYAWF